MVSCSQLSNITFWGVIWYVFTAQTIFGYLAVSKVHKISSPTAVPSILTTEKPPPHCWSQASYSAPLLMLDMRVMGPEAAANLDFRREVQCTSSSFRFTAPERRSGGLRHRDLLNDRCKKKQTVNDSWGLTTSFLLVYIQHNQCKQKSTNKNFESKKQVVFFFRL